MPIELNHTERNIASMKNTRAGRDFNFQKDDAKSISLCYVYVAAEQVQNAASRQRLTVRSRVQIPTRTKVGLPSHPPLGNDKLVVAFL